MKGQTEAEGRRQSRGVDRGKRKEGRKEQRRGVGGSNDGEKGQNE